MPRVRMLTVVAGPDYAASPGQVVNVSKQEAKDLIDGGFAVDANAADAGPSERATGRRGRSATVSGEDTASTEE